MDSDNIPDDSAAPDPRDPHAATPAQLARATWGVSTDTLRASLSHCPTDQVELVVGAFRWCVDPAHPIPLTEFAARVGVSANTIYRVTRGKYLSPETGERLPIPSKLVDSIRGFLATERARADLGRVRFVETPTAIKIWRACDLARESQTPVFVIGPSHVGKTWALQEYCSRNNHGRSIYCRLQAASGLGGMVRRIAEACGVSPKANTADLVDRIKRAISKDQILILDELHQLAHTYRKESFFACLEVIREIYDECQCGLVLCGTRLLDKRFKEGAGELEQLVRRGVHRFALPDAPLAADVRAVVEDWGLTMPRPKETVEVSGVREIPYDLLRQLAAAQGLKAITERLRYGLKLAGRAGQELAWAHVCEAHLLISSSADIRNDWV